MDHVTRQRIAFRRLGVIACDPSAPATPEMLVPYLAELGHLGIRVTNPDALTDAVTADWSTLQPIITEARGGGRSYTPLFDGFPERLPNYDVGALRFLMGAVRLLSLDHVAASAHEFGWAGALNVTDDDVRQAMDFSSVGWWPASSVRQDVAADILAKQAQELLLSDERVEWIDVRVVASDELDVLLRQFMADCAYSAASLQADVSADFVALVDHFGITEINFSLVRFAEIRALLTSLLFARALTDLEARDDLIALGLSPDDLLRMFAAQAGGDVSLHERVKIPRMTRGQRRLVLWILETSPRLSDVFRRRGLWLAVGESLHVGEYARRFPLVGAMFTRLRAERRDQHSVMSIVERHLAAGEYVLALNALELLAPSLLARHLRRLASLAQTETERVALQMTLAMAGERIPLRTLFAARAQIVDNGYTYPRLAVTKAGGLLPILREPGHLAVDVFAQDGLIGALSNAIQAGCAAKGAWQGERVWIDPILEGILVPDQLRSTSDGFCVLDRGSRVPLGEARVLRMFVHWREGDQRSDLDLSCIALDENFRAVDHVSWTNLGNGVMTHSGDLTSAPQGASEFLDIRLDAVRGRYRYLAPSIYRFSGPSFGQLPEAVVGWMLRDECNSDRKTFDIATVANAFRLIGSKGTAIPFVYDVDANEIIYLDGYLRSPWGAMVEKSAESTEMLGRTLSTRHRIRTSVAELARVHAAARGAVLVDDRESATITFGTDADSTYDAFRPGKLLAELL